MNEGPTGSDPGQRGSDLSDLRSRLAALHGSVERLGRDDDRVPPPAPAEPAPYAYADPAAPQPPEPPTPAYEPLPPQPPIAPDPYAEQPPQQPEQDWGYNPYAEPAEPQQQPQVDAYGYPVPPAPAPAADPYQPAPAATNGQGEPDAGVAAVEANIAILDIGPFADLIELRHFEEAVIRLEAVRDVRVRRFGHFRAIVELGLAGPYAIGRELLRLGRPMQVEPGPEGEVIVDFTDVPDDPRPDAAAVAAETTEDESVEAAEKTDDDDEGSV